VHKIVNFSRGGAQSAENKRKIKNSATSAAPREANVKMSHAEARICDAENIEKIKDSANSAAPREAAEQIVL